MTVFGKKTRLGGNDERRMRGAVWRHFVSAAYTPIISYYGVFRRRLEFFLRASSGLYRTFPLARKFPAQTQQGDIFGFGFQHDVEGAEVVRADRIPELDEL